MLYTIERDFTGYAQDEVDAAAFRAELCISFFSGMAWVRSFFDGSTQQARCFYEATSVESLRTHAFSMAIPIGEIRPVTEIRRSKVSGIESGEPVDVTRSRELDDELSIWIARFSLDGGDEKSLLATFTSVADQDPAWVRAFVDRGLDEVWSVYRSRGSDDAQASAGLTGLPLKLLREMQEVLPEDVVKPTVIGVK